MHRKSWNTQKSKPQTYNNNNNNNNNNNLHREPIVNTKTNSHGRSWNRESVTPLIFNAKSATAKVILIQGRQDSDLLLYHFMGEMNLVAEHIQKTKTEPGRVTTQLCPR